MRRQQRGVAVIVAMLIVTLAASTAAFAVWQQSLWVRQLENITDRSKADQLAAAGIDVARDVLRRDDNIQVDSLNDPWAQPVTLPGENAETSGLIVDQQGLFNLNNLVSSSVVNNIPASVISQPDVDYFKRLLVLLKLPEQLANAVVDWIDSDSEVTFPGGAEDSDYLNGETPYVTPNRPMTDIAELARIKGFKEEYVRALAPFVTALPVRTTINVNTAPPEVLAALVPNWSVDGAQAAVKTRLSTPFQGTQDFLALLPSSSAPPVQLSVNSNYFAVSVKVSAGRVEAGYLALLQRGQAGWPVIIWRKEAAD